MLPNAEVVNLCKPIGDSNLWTLYVDHLPLTQSVEVQHSYGSNEWFTFKQEDGTPMVISGAERISWQFWPSNIFIRVVYSGDSTGMPNINLR